MAMRPFDYKKAFIILMIIVVISLTVGYTARGVTFRTTNFNTDLGDVVDMLDDIAIILDNIGKELEQIRYKL
jgi:hypothetical protein